MKLLISFIFIVITVAAVEQENPKKPPFETDRNAESIIKQKVNFENKAKAPASTSKAVAADEKSLTVPTQSNSAESKSTNPEVQKSETPSSESQLIVCKSGAEVRNIEMRKKGSGCEVTYTKKGESKVIAHQRLGNLRCDHVFQDLQSKLTKGGFVCESK